MRKNYIVLGTALGIIIIALMGYLFTKLFPIEIPWIFNHIAGLVN